MNSKIFAALALFAVSVTVCAQVQLTNLDQKSFKIDVTGAPTNVVNLFLRNTQFSPSTTGWVLTNISGVFGGSTNIVTNSIWGIDGFGNITPVVANNAVLATNIVRYGVGRMFGTESWLSKALTLTNGPNYIGAAENSQFFLIGPTTNPADCQIILSNAVATGQKLVLVNQTNAIPAEGAWTMTNNTPIPDGAGVVKLLGGFDLVSTNGYISYFEFISPDWQEVGRILASGASGLLTNVFNNIVVYSNITLKGNSTLTINNLTITTNDLWHTNLVGGASTLQPVNLGLQPLVGKGWLSGTNTPGSGLLPLSLPFNVLSSVRSEDIGDPAASYMYIAQARNNNNPKSFLSFVASTNALTFQVGANDGTDQSTMNLVTANGSDIELNLQKNSTNFTLMYPTRGATLTPYHFGTDKTHTSSNIFEIANNDTNWWTFGISGAGTTAELGLHSQSGDLSSIRATNGINFNIDVAGGYQWRMNGIGFEPEFDGSTLASNLHPINGGHFNNVIWGDGGAGVADTSGNGSPEGVAAAAVGSVWRNTNGAPGTTLYVKETGTGNTGWTAIGAGGGGSILWYQYTATDQEGGIANTTSSTNGFLTDLVRFTGNFLTNMWGEPSENVSIGGGTPDPGTLTNWLGMGNYNIGHNAGNGSIVDPTSSAISDLSSSAGINMVISNSSNILNLGNLSAFQGVIRNSSDINNLGPQAGQNSIIEGSTFIGNIGKGAGDSAAITNSTIVLNFFQGGLSQVLSNVTDMLNVGSSGGSFQVANDSYTVINFYGGVSAVQSGSHEIGNFGLSAGNFQTNINSFDIENYGNVSGLQGYNSNTFNVFNGQHGGEFQVNFDSARLLNLGDGSGIHQTNHASQYISNLGPFAGENQDLTNSFGITSIGYKAGRDVTGTHTNVVLIGQFSTIGATGNDQVILGPNMTLTAPGGFSSLATDAAVAITTTGITNNLGKLAFAYIEGTNLVFTLKDSSNTPYFTNSVVIGIQALPVQAGGAITISAGTASGVLKAL